MCSSCCRDGKRWINLNYGSGSALPGDKQLIFVMEISIIKILEYRDLFPNETKLDVPAILRRFSRERLIRAMLCYPYAFNDGKMEVQLPYGITDAYNYCIEHKCDKLASRVRKFFSGPCMKLIPISFIQDRRYDIKFKNGEDSLFMFLISDKIKRVAFTSKNAVYYRRYRNDSAVTRKRNKSEIIINSFNLIKAYSCIYFKTPKSYSLSFLITRLLGTVRSMFK